MLNHILVSELWDDNVKYSLDPHASSPFVMNKCGVTLTITQDGWKVFCNNAEVINSLCDKEVYSVTAIPDEDNCYLVDFKRDSAEMDYIDLAKTIIIDVEAAYEGRQILDNNSQS